MINVILEEFIFIKQNYVTISDADLTKKGKL